MIIVIAWDEFRTRQPWPGVTERISNPVACIWVNDGTEEDAVKARDHASTIDGAQVFTYHEDEVDPIGRAKAEII